MTIVSTPLHDPMALRLLRILPRSWQKELQAYMKQYDDHVDVLFMTKGKEVLGGVLIFHEHVPESHLQQFSDAKKRYCGYLYIRPLYRGKGLSKKLMHECIARNKQYTMWLACRRGLVGLYGAMGFTVESITKTAESKDYIMEHHS